MAARSRREVSLSAAALESLREIWLWNAEHYGEQHSDRYQKFLENAIDKLARPETAGQQIPGRPDLRYLLIRRRPRGHGHVAVFHAIGNRVTVLRIFHTAQDWQTEIVGDSEPD